MRNAYYIFIAQYCLKSNNRFGFKSCDKKQANGKRLKAIRERLMAEGKRRRAKGIRIAKVKKVLRVASCGLKWRVND